MKILVCQISPRVGDLIQNTQSISNYYNLATDNEADICVFPELCLTGYFAEDLFLRQDFLSQANKQANLLIKNTSSTCLLLPTIIQQNNMLYNGVIAAQNGKIIDTTCKVELPNYQTFDEKRYFTPGKSNIIIINGIKFGIPICEDIWYPKVCSDLYKQGAEIFIVPNASPYEKNKFTQRVKLVKNIYQNTKTPIIYCNQALAHDGIIFDGKSFCYDSKLTIIGKSFSTNYSLIRYTNKKFIINNSYKNEKNVTKDILHASILGTKEYVHNNEFKKAVIGLSGGIDSAIVAVIAAKALGKENILCYMLPSKFTSKESLDDALSLVNKLGVTLKTIPIQHLIDEVSTSISKEKEIYKNTTYQNIQSRIRGTILMAMANNSNALLLTTGNKSEYATGFATIYGDMNGAFNPIKDLYKTEIFQLAKYLNSQSKDIIPSSIINKQPSAELSFNQKDSDSLPNYAILDQILYHLIEEHQSPKKLYSKFNPDIVTKVVKLIKNSEFKRSQSAPGVKISCQSFDKDRRIPITNLFQDF